MEQRAFAGWDDVVAVHAFLAEAYQRHHGSRTWEVRRWEGRWWHDDPAEVERSLDRHRRLIRIWEDAPDHLVAVAHPEGPQDVHLQLAESQPDLADEMLAWAESSDLPDPADPGTRHLTTFALTDDTGLRTVLESRGYRTAGWGEIHRWRTLDTPIDVGPPAQGYRVRALEAGDRDDASRLASLINASFGHAFGPEALLNFERSPSFVPACQIVAEAPDGTHAAHAGVVIDRHNALAIVEPVCAHPDHRRRGLAAACISEGLERARVRGATRATVSTGTGNPSDHLYASLGFTDLVETLDAWCIELGAAR